MKMTTRFQASNTIIYTIVSYQNIKIIIHFVFKYFLLKRLTLSKNIYSKKM